MPPDFPDQPYLDRIRAALWHRGTQGNASVMVGAGMSLNARSRGADSGRFPTWSDLARTVADQLYPPHGGARSEHRSHALLQANSTSGFLRLAQEYETAFGREALERLITNTVPDLRFEPGDLHQRLLALPWSDIFTTNWDTLLERGATHVVDRHYDVVRTVADIPGSARPRIVKLHGSLPATRPLIFTEEDFRTYPVRFAPFVNLAQQSMMESVFCLIGFSGEDPNFLYWSGWVRDHLRDYAPHIYLVGWLDLPPPRRRMLEGRGVVPIDLAHLPLQAPWPEEIRHQRALEWFLWSLEAAEPYKKTDWPKVSYRRLPNPSTQLPGVLVEDRGFPRQENFRPKRSADLEEFWNTVKVWRHNRHLYPGWLIATRSARHQLWRATVMWISVVLELLPALEPAEQIEVLDELNWRLETALVPLTTQLATVVAEILSAVDPMGLSRELRDRWVRLAFGILRAAREGDDDAAIERWTGALAPHRPSHAWLGPRIAYERCLLGLARLDHVAVERALDDLDTSADEVFWKVRKAGILAELGKTEAAFQLASEALPEIRQQLGHGEADIPTLSREGWAMKLAEGFILYPPSREPELETNSLSTGPRGLEPLGRATRRWEVLERHGCDAREELSEMWRTLEDEPRGPEPEVVEKFGFDLWHRTRIGRGERWNFGGDGWEHLPALQAKRLLEEAGIPPVVDHVELTKKLLLRAAVWLTEPVPNSALGILLRVSTYEEDETFQVFFNRSRIAQLADEQVEDLVARVEHAVEYAIPKAAAARTEGDHERATYWVSRMRVAVDLLSRLVLRLDEVRARRVLDRALGFYRLPLFRQHHWLIKPLGHLFSRTLKALDTSHIRAQLPGLLALPLPDEGDFEVEDPRNWPDPFCLAAERLDDSPQELGAAPEWAGTIDRLITAVAGTPGLFPRWPAIVRLEFLFRWGILSEEQVARFADALWQHRPTRGGFPMNTEFFDFAFLALPTHGTGLAEELFRQKYLAALKVRSKLYSEEFFRNLSGVTEIQQQGRTKFILSAADIDQILECILAEWRSGRLGQKIENARPWSARFDLESYKEALADSLGMVILPRLEPAAPKVREVVAMIADLRNLNFPTEPTYPALARLQPDLMPELSDRLRQSLVSSHKDQAEAGVETVWWWLREGRQLGLGEPPPDLVREIAIAVSMRRPSLQHALRATEWILRNNAVVEVDRFARLVVEGLGYLLLTARYEAGLVQQSDMGLRPNEIAEVRILCVKVALALECAGFVGLRPVGEWIREGRSDPFPEVRHALSESKIAVPAADGTESAS